MIYKYMITHGRNRVCNNFTDRKLLINDSAALRSAGVMTAVGCVAENMASVRVADDKW